MRKLSLTGRELDLYDDIFSSIRDGTLVERGKTFVSDEISKWIEQRKRELFGEIQIPSGEKLRPYVEIAEKIIEDNYADFPLPHYVNSKDDLKRDGKQALGVYDVYTSDTHEYESGYTQHRIVNIYIPEKELIPELLGENYSTLREKSGIKDEGKFLDRYQKRITLHEYIEVAYRDINGIWDRDLTDEEHGEVESLVLDTLRYLAQRGSEEAKEIYSIALEEHKMRDVSGDALTREAAKFNPGLKKYLTMLN
jgi:hypothetical protein